MQFFCERASVSTVYAKKLIFTPSLCTCNGAGPRLLKFAIAVQGPLSRDHPWLKISRRRKRYTLQFIRTHAHTSPVWTVRVVSLLKTSSDRRLFAAHKDHAFRMLIEFAPNPTYTFPAPTATRGVSMSTLNVHLANCVLHSRIYTALAYCICSRTPLPAK